MAAMTENFRFQIGDCSYKFSPTPAYLILISLSLRASPSRPIAS
jgi:hypothetical protein